MNKNGFTLELLVCIVIKLTNQKEEKIIVDNY